jgi:putative acetyltransferase
MGSKAPSIDNYTIRAATNADADAIRAVLRSVRKEYGVLHEAGPNDPEFEDLENNVLRDGGRVQVVLDGEGHVVGCAALMRRGAKRAELGKMYLEPSARGCGLGKRLLEDLLHAARCEGFEEVWLETNSVLHTAIALYTKYGFRPIPADHLHPHCDQAYLLKLDRPIPTASC